MPGHSTNTKQRKVLVDHIQGITKPAIRRLARRGGVKRISGLIYEETRGVLKVFLENVIRDAVTYTEHARRKTVMALDVVYALKRQGRTLYGFGGGTPTTQRNKNKHKKLETVSVGAPYAVAYEDGTPRKFTISRSGESNQFVIDCYTIQGRYETNDRTTKRLTGNKYAECSNFDVEEIIIHPSNKKGGKQWNVFVQANDLILFQVFRKVDAVGQVQEIKHLNGQLMNGDENLFGFAYATTSTRRPASLDIIFITGKAQWGKVNGKQRDNWRSAQPGIVTGYPNPFATLLLTNLTENKSTVSILDDAPCSQLYHKHYIGTKSYDDADVVQSVAKTEKIELMYRAAGFTPFLNPVSGAYSLTFDKALSMQEVVSRLNRGV